MLRKALDSACSLRALKVQEIAEDVVNVYNPCFKAIGAADYSFESFSPDYSRSGAVIAEAKTSLLGQFSDEKAFHCFAGCFL